MKKLIAMAVLACSMAAFAGAEPKAEAETKDTKAKPKNVKYGNKKTAEPKKEEGAAPAKTE